MNQPNLQEEELLEVLKDKGEASGAEIAKVLGWGSSKLYTTLAGLEERGVVTSRWATSEYPTKRVYKLIRS